jgi:nuclear pore complex protein Nup155
MNPVTPVRQIPGAFINTPAPGPNTARRRLNFNETAGAGTNGTTLGTTPGPITSTMGSGQQEIATGMLPPPHLREDLPPVAKAAQVVNQTLQLDESYPDIDSYCRRMFLSLPYLFLCSASCALDED